MSKMFKSNETINQENKDSKVKKIFKEVFFSFSWLAIILLICDIITKVCAEKFLTGKGSVVVIPHLLNFTLTYNNGAAWGMGGDATWSRVILALISWAVAIAIIVYVIMKYKTINNYLRATIMVILAGDVGNLIDRTFFCNRGVIDFFDITPLIKGFGIFNFADSCLVVGIIMLLIYFLIEWINESKNEKKNKEIADKNGDDSKK